MKIIFKFIVILLISFLMLPPANVKSYSSDKNVKYNVLIDLNECRLFVISKETNEVVKVYPVAGGRPETPSPIGTWTVISRAHWAEGFGTRWMGLNVPWGIYGIHGTDKPHSIGGHASHGCIRMLNHDVEDLYKYVKHGTAVVIYGGPYGLYSNHFRDLLPGDRGADVYEVQRKLKVKGYYNGALDGIYGEALKSQIIKYRKDNKLRITHDIDKEFYDSIGMKSFE